MMRIAWARFVGNMLEQPTTSLMMEMDRLKECFALTDMTIVTTYLSSFGGETSKPIKLAYDKDRDWCSRLVRSDEMRSDKENVSLLVTGSGRKSS